MSVCLPFGFPQRKNLSSLTFRIGILCTSALAGFAAQANTNNEYEIYEITSRKQSQPFIDAPVSALVVGGDYIEWNQIADIQTPRQPHEQLIFTSLLDPRVQSLL